MKVQVTLLSEPNLTFELHGRLGWAIARLAVTGAKGITTIEYPAPSWPFYVHQLRGLGIPIDTEMEQHHGAYPGRHARYRLSCDVDIVALDTEVA